MKRSGYMKTIASFQVNHDKLTPGIYVSRIDGDVTTYDLRTRIPNAGDYMDHLTMHSLEHMFATYVRNSALGPQVLYFGPMGCQTGFYLLIRNAENEVVLAAVKEVLQSIIDHDGEMFGADRIACGNYKNLSVASAKDEAKRYLDALNAIGEVTFRYEE